MISETTDPFCKASTSAAACRCSSVKYSTTGGQAPCSEPAVAQALSKVIAITGAIRPGFQHPA